MTATTWRIAGLTLAATEAPPRVLHQLTHRLDPIRPEPPDLELGHDSTRGLVEVSRDGMPGSHRHEAASVVVRGAPTAVALESVPADVTLAWRPPLSEAVLEVEGDAGDGRTVLRTLDGAWLARGDGLASLPAADTDTVAVEIRGGFPLRPLLAEIVHPAIHRAAPRHGTVCVHGAGAVLDGHGLLFAGWSESGKTEAALAVLEAGGDLVSDKWTALDERGGLATLPGRVSLRPWVVPYLPVLGSRLGRGARVRLETGRAAGRLVPRIERALPSLPAGDVLGPAVARGAALATRYTVGLRGLRGLYGRDGDLPRPALEVAVLLTPAPVAAPRVREADPSVVAERLADSAAYERRAWWELARRRAYVLPGSADPADAERDARARERELLQAVLGARCVLEVTAPFPGDPRRILDAIRRWI